MATHKSKSVASGLFTYYFTDNSPVVPGVPKRPIRFKLRVRTGNPLSWVSENLPANEVTGARFKF